MSTKRQVGFNISLPGFKRPPKIQRITRALANEQPTNTTYVTTDCLSEIQDRNISLGAKPAILKLVITRKAYIKLLCYINLIGDYEISGFGRIQPTSKEKTFKVIDFDILKQEVRGAYVESSEDAVMNFIRRIPTDQLQEWTLDWHSHVNMCTSPSGTDWTNYQEMFEARLNKQFPIMIVNKREEITSYQIVSKNKHESIEVAIDISTPALSHEEVKAIYDECEKQIKELCKKYEVTTYSYSPNYWSNTHYENESLLTPKKKEKEKVEEDDCKWYTYDDTQEEWEDDDEIKEAKKQGYIFDSFDTSQRTLCPNCGRPLISNHEKDLGICEECFQEINRGY